MSKIIYRTIWWLFSTLCILIGLYPVIYFLVDRNFGLLSSKTQELLTNQFWNIGFYGHIILGGIALLIGWTQFSPKLRRKRIKLHRIIGKIYTLSVLISGVCGVYIAQFATGGISNVIGFSLSGIIWLTTTFLAYKAIKKVNIEQHQNYMLYSYAVCFSAVTLRIWLPVLTHILGEFESAYPIVGWLSWVPNLIVAFYIIKRRKTKSATYNV
ncbi:DUF2306 domain-containing protein [Roseivirga misakiensis]|uniref:DUF2306 domain-containing protein n=1 Tax=Roseivirga misakiensis TaxID=1563681 RepID=A0A1E5SLB0_9BACT|nr:DUF2306 domain-containing protein [Roseivirga misakiensis]OEJ99912.1 hypothetical protein BFP71_10215 [Roseivirga misakiensis]